MSTSHGRIHEFVILLIIFVMQGCSKSGFLNMSESLDWKLPKDFALVEKTKTGWKGVRGDETFRTVYLSKLDTRTTWKVKAEMLELPIAITSTGMFHWDAPSVMNWLKAGVEKEQCSTDHWKVLQKDSTGILYEWEDISCSAWPTQHEIVRVVMGKWYVWVISFGVRNMDSSGFDKDALIANLRDAKIGARATVQ